MVWGFLLLSYLLGSIPWGYIIGRAWGRVDIRTVGDGNVGAKNVYHRVGRWAGVAVGLLDFAKGAIVVLLARKLGLPEIGVYAAGAAVVLGHDLPLFLRFRGGQGFATTVGVFFVLMPQETLFSLAVTGLALGLSRRWDLSNAVGLALLPLAAWWTNQPLSHIIYIAVLLPLVALKKFLDRPRRRHIAERDPSQEAQGEPEWKQPRRL